MLDAGEIGPDDFACAHGTEDWIPVEMAIGTIDEPGLGAVEPPLNLAMRVVQRPWMLCALVTFLLGVVTLLAFWPLGLLLIVIALVIDRPHHVCGYCGNRIERTSTMCPVCGVGLVKRLPKKRK